MLLLLLLTIGFDAIFCCGVIICYHKREVSAEGMHMNIWLVMKSFIFTGVFITGTDHWWGSVDNIH